MNAEDKTCPRCGETFSGVIDGFDCYGDPYHLGVTCAVLVLKQQLNAPAPNLSAGAGWERIKSTGERLAKARYHEDRMVLVRTQDLNWCMATMWAAVYACEAALKSTWFSSVGADSSQEAERIRMALKMSGLIEREERTNP